MRKKLESGNVHVVVIEFDQMEHEKSYGPIVWETYLHKSSLLESVEKQQKLSKRYGKAIICKLVPLSDDEIRATTKKSSRMFKENAA